MTSLVKITKHPTRDLWIANYTQEAQFSGALKTDPNLRHMRGYITDASGTCIARGFPKFFNLGEQPEVDALYKDQTPRIEEKLDGSMGILYYSGDSWAIATRGSFHSEQAVAATAMLAKYQEFLDQLDPKGPTYLFEIIYPDNRIVVDYGERRDLVYIGCVDRDGNDVEPPVPWPGPTKRVFDTLAPRPGEEGFVLVYPDGHRVKVKFAEYLALHRAKFGLTEDRVHEALKAGALAELVEIIPDEFKGWLDTVVARMTSEFEDLHGRAAALFASAPKGSRKEFAAYALATDMSKVLFAMLDGRPCVSMLWDLVEIGDTRP